MEFSKFYLTSIILLISAYESSPTWYPPVLKTRRRCSTLPTTKNAGLRCVMNGFQKCHAICLAGHVLQHNQKSTKTAVTCRNGHWNPRTAQCVLSNTCRLKLVDAGEVTCKATTNSYKCHITCYSAKRSTSTYTCNSKTKTWFPHLPKCAKPKSYSPNLWTEEGNGYVGKTVHYQPGGNGRHQPERIGYVQPGGNGHFQPGRSGYFQPGGHGRPGIILFYPRGHTNRPKIRPEKKGPTLIQKNGLTLTQKKGPTIIQEKERNGHQQTGISGYFQPGGKGRPGRIVFYPRGHTNRLKNRPGKKGPTIIQKKGPTIIQKKGPTITQNKGRNGHHQPRKSGYFQPGGKGRPGRIVLYPRGHTNRFKIRPVKKGPRVIQKKGPRVIQKKGPAIIQKKGPTTIQKKFLQKVKMGPRKVYDFVFTIE